MEIVHYKQNFERDLFHLTIPVRWDKKNGHTTKKKGRNLYLHLLFEML